MNPNDASLIHQSQRELDRKNREAASAEVAGISHIATIRPPKFHDFTDDAYWAAREKDELARQQQEQSRREQLRQAAQRRRAESIPTIYRAKFDRALAQLDQKTIDYVARWTSGARKGIGLLGSTGLGKTRLLCARLLTLPAHVSWLYLPAARLAKCVREQWDDNYGVANSAEGTLKDARRVRVLMLDDVGDESASEAVGEEFKELIEWRTSREMPIFWTSNLTSQELASHHRTRGAAIVRRLKEFTWTP